MKIDYFRYPWRVLFDDLAEENHTALPVASGACIRIGAAKSLHTSLPVRHAYIDGNRVKIHEIPDTDEEGRVSKLSYDGQQISAKIGAYGGFKAEEGEKASNLNVLIEESLRYIQRIEDIISSNTSKNAGQLPSVPWEQAIDELSSIDWQSEVAKKPLIVELAERQGHPLKEISRGAKEYYDGGAIPKESRKLANSIKLHSYASHSFPAGQFPKRQDQGKEYLQLNATRPQTRSKIVLWSISAGSWKANGGAHKKSHANA